MIATPHPVHMQQALHAPASDKYVFWENPVAMTAAGAAEIFGAAAESAEAIKAVIDAYQTPHRLGCSAK